MDTDVLEEHAASSFSAEVSYSFAMGKCVVFSLENYKLKIFRLIPVRLPARFMM
jgi:hypothetical protein